MHCLCHLLTLRSDSEPERAARRIRQKEEFKQLRAERKKAASAVPTSSAAHFEHTASAAVVGSDGLMSSRRPGASSSELTILPFGLIAWLIRFAKTSVMHDPAPRLHLPLSRFGPCPPHSVSPARRLMGDRQSKLLKWIALPMSAAPRPSPRPLALSRPPALALAPLLRCARPLSRPPPLHRAATPRRHDLRLTLLLPLSCSPTNNGLS